MSEARLAALRDPSSQPYQLVLKMVKQVLDRDKLNTCMGKKKVSVHLDSALPYADLSFLKDEFGYDFDSKPQGIVVVNPFLSAYAKCVARSFEDQKAWKGEETVHVNGDVRQLVIRGFGGLKVVRHYGDVSMHQSFFEEDEFVKRSRSSRNERMKEHAVAVWNQFVEGQGDSVSKEGSRSIITGDTVYVDPLRYRVGLREVAAEVVRRDAQRAKGWLPISSEVLRACSGSLFGGRVSFVVDMDNGKVVFFEKGKSTPSFEYRLADYFSYLTRKPFVVDGSGFVLEFHGSCPDRLDYILTRVDASDIDTIQVEKVPLWTKGFEKPGILVSLQVRSDLLGIKPDRVVLRDDPELFSKSVASLIGGSAPITMSAARSARAMYRDQVMLPSGGVILPKAADPLVEEILARAVFRRATYARALMLAEESVANESFENAKAVSESLSRAVCSIMWSTGKGMVEAFSAPTHQLAVAALDDTWDVAIVQETPRMWLDTCWSHVISKVEGDGFRDPAYWPTGVDRDVWERATAALSKNVIKDSVMHFFSQEEPASYGGPPLMGEEREKAAARVSGLVGAEDRPSVSRVVLKPLPLVKPMLSPAVVGTNIDDAMKEEFDREFPGLSMVDVDARPYLVAEADRVISPNAPLMKVPLVDKPVLPTVYLSTGFNVGVSGPRPRSVNEVISAFVGRVAGAPTYMWDIDLNKALGVEFDRFAAVFLKPGWEDDVARRVNSGYMYPTQQDVRKVVGKMSPTNVSRIGREDFKPEGILMTVLKAMVKREPKDRQDIGVAFEHKPNQTIMYQESKITNAYFSASLSKFHDCLDDNLRDGFMVNPRVDKAKVEEVWNSVEPVCSPGEGETVKVVDIDISQCDKSQVAANMLRYMYLLCRFGFGDFVVLWEQMIKMKRASDPSQSVLVEFLAQVVSGYFNTISANSCIVGWATANSLDVEPSTVKRVVVSGDDVVAYVVSKQDIKLNVASERFSTQFNFDAKINIESSGLYWCGRLGVKVQGYTFFVKDLGRIRSSYFKSQGLNYDPEEAWDSFLDDTVAYEHEELVVGAAEAYARRRGLDFIPIGTARAIASLRKDKAAFIGRFESMKRLG